MRRLCAGIAALFLFGVAAMAVSDASALDGRGNQFHDELLENLVGKWHINRKVGKRVAENTAEVKWVLNHQFLQIHMIDVAKPPHYEALVLVGYSNEDKRYVIHWMDTFGGKYSLIGNGIRDGNSIKFKFGDGADEIHNTFTWQPESKTWRSLIEQGDKSGKWGVFAEDLYRR